MLNKLYRLKKYSAFDTTYKIKDMVSDNNFCIYFGKKKTNPDVITKFGFVVSKKIHKRAVVRNRIKRLMREYFRLFIKNSENTFINDYISLICVARADSVGLCYEEVNKSLNTLLKKHG